MKLSRFITNDSIVNEADSKFEFIELPKKLGERVPMVEEIFKDKTSEAYLTKIGGQPCVALVFSKRHSTYYVRNDFDIETLTGQDDIEEQIEAVKAPQFVAISDEEDE